MAAYACADLHLGHRNIPKYRMKPDDGPLDHTAMFKNFVDTEEHDNFIEERWREMGIKTRRDTIYVVGDIAFTAEGWERFDALPGRKVVILGNHCTEHATVDKIAALKTVNSVHSMLKYKGMWITHAPLHPAHLRGKRNLHGHLHSELVRDPRYFNCSLEHTGMRPMPLEEIYEEFDRRRSFNYVRQTLGWRAALQGLRNG